MKRLVIILFSLCSATLACYKETDTNPPANGRKPSQAAAENDPVELLRVLKTAEETLQRDPDSETARFDRALAQEKLYLTKEAIQSWDALAPRSEEAREHRDRLMRLPDPAELWSVEEIEGALRRRDRATLTRLARAFPAMAVRYFEEFDVLKDLEGARLFADVVAELGDRYPRAIVDHAAQAKDRAALAEGIRALHEKKPDDAAKLLERAGSPLYLTAQYRIAALQFSGEESSSPLLDEIAPVAANAGYRDLAARIHTLRADALGVMGNYLEALTVYEKALEYAGNNSIAIVEVRVRRSATYAVLGSVQDAFRQSVQALELLPGVPDLNARHQAYGTTAIAARSLGHTRVALQYQNEAVEQIRKNLAGRSGLVRAKTHYAIALRERANIHVELGHDSEAEADLRQAFDLAEAANYKSQRDLLKMRLNEVSGQLLLKKNPIEAVAKFDQAIKSATEENSTYRAVLHFKRAAARRNAGDVRADDDIAKALKILRDEATLFLKGPNRSAYESLWTPYFSRFQEMYHQIIESRVAANDMEGAFLYADQARAFEPLQIVLQSHPVPPGFRKLETKDDLRQQLSLLPEHTFILHYLVLPTHTYTWVLSRGRIELFRQRAGRKDIERRLAAVDDLVKHAQQNPFRTAMRGAYDDLFSAPLAKVPRSPHTRIVIVPDGPMHGLPFAALQGTKNEGYLIERGSVAVAGSTSLYFYALMRDRQFASNTKNTVLVVGDPAFTPRPNFHRLPHSRTEVEQLAREYSGAQLLADRDATVPRFLESAKNATIIHFAGHAIANSQSPWHSMLLLAPQGNVSGDLTAETLMTGLSELERTRLVVLGACRTAGGQAVGPEGVAPLVRPLIAANVPAVVGTLWDVKDATAKNLLVSFHCHYRNGDDVAVALRHAQLEMLRNNEPAMAWALFQVVGYAGSPYARPAALEETHSEHVCTQNSLHRPDGLHPQ